MRKEDGTAACLWFETAEDVLPKGLVGTALGRGAVEVASPWISGEGGTVPLFDGIRRIGKDNIKLHKPIAFNELRLRKSVPAYNLKVFNAMEKTIHPSDGGGHQVSLLAIELNVSPFLPLSAEMGDTREKHST